MRVIVDIPSGTYDNLKDNKIQLGSIASRNIMNAVKAGTVITEGEWVFVQYDANPNIGNFHCSECRYVPSDQKQRDKRADSLGLLHNFCPNCGADMRKGISK